MSKTGTEDARAFVTEGRDLLLEARGELPRAKRPALVETLLAGDCPHTDLSADKRRCLGCGMWSHQLVGLPEGVR